jgi:hypothetical protein
VARFFGGQKDGQISDVFWSAHTPERHLPSGCL